MTAQDLKTYKLNALEAIQSLFDGHGLSGQEPLLLLHAGHILLKPLVATSLNEFRTSQALACDLHLLSLVCKL